jgi:hypothetical protein
MFRRVLHAARVKTLQHAIFEGADVASLKQHELAGPNTSEAKTGRRKASSVEMRSKAETIIEDRCRSLLIAKALVRISPVRRSSGRH